MRRITYLLLALLLTGCSAFRTTPQPPPAPGPQAQQINRAQSMTLTKLANITATERGSPDDAERALAAQANAAGAPYYHIIMISETVIPGVWYGTATLYGTASATGGTQQ
ncbi:biofilm peroxide resistance protein BsmA [Erwinia sp. V71]|uniref:biofilm peroxide resistance protein BsmA n=1 Tax=Erwinia sp. V71 TaxID=3369424 RepID=UPI003F618ECA